MLIFLLQNMGCVTNMKKSILQPVKQTEFLELQIKNTNEMTLSHLEEILNPKVKQYQGFTLNQKHQYQI